MVTAKSILSSIHNTVPTSIGAIFSLPMALQGFYVPGKEWFILIGTIVMRIIYGFFIELFTTVVFKQGAQRTAS